MAPEPVDAPEPRRSRPPNRCGGSGHPDPADHLVDCPRRYRFTSCSAPPPKGPVGAHESGPTSSRAGRLVALQLTERTPGAAAAARRGGSPRGSATDAVGPMARRGGMVERYLGRRDQADERSAWSAPSGCHQRLALSGRSTASTAGPPDGEELVIEDYKTAAGPRRPRGTRSRALAVYALASGGCCAGRRAGWRCTPADGQAVEHEHNDESLAGTGGASDRCEAAAAVRPARRLAAASPAAIDVRFPPPRLALRWCDSAALPRGPGAAPARVTWAGLTELADGSAPTRQLDW